VAVVDRWLQLHTARADVSRDLAVALAHLVVAEFITHFGLACRGRLKHLLVFKRLLASAWAVNVARVAEVALEVVVDARARLSLDDGLVVLAIKARRVLLTANVGGLLSKVALVVGVVAAVIWSPCFIVGLGGARVVNALAGSLMDR